MNLYKSELLNLQAKKIPIDRIIQNAFMLKICLLNDKY